MTRLKKLAYHDLYDRDYAMIYINGEFIKHETHAECVNEYFKNNKIKPFANVDHIDNRQDVEYELKNNNKLIEFACINVTNNNYYIEPDTLQNISAYDLAKKIKSQFPNANVFKDTPDYIDNYIDYHDEDTSKYFQLAKLK